MSDKGYQVIARRWRPKQFSELVGQDHVVKTLGNAIDLGRIAHAYLFVGPRGTGKTTSARLFAKSLNWEDGPSLEVPEDSEIGQAIMEGRCLDVIEIDGASNNSVEQVRDLRDECQYAPSQCRFKIYVIDEVHMLSQQAFNALLKTLEEPPPHVKFVFATTESHKVLPTIVSRCQRFEFRSIAPELIVGKLAEICQKEGIDAQGDALQAIARMALGGMRDAQSILDQMISFCGKTIAQKDVLEVYGLASSEQIADLSQSILEGEYEKILQITEELSDLGLDFYRALLDLSERFRQLLLDSLRGTGKSTAPEQIARMLDVLQDGESLVRLGLSDKANFEVTMFRAMEAGRTRSIDQVIRRISGIIPKEAKKKTPLTSAIRKDENDEQQVDYTAPHSPEMFVSPTVVSEAVSIHETVAVSEPATEVGPPAPKSDEHHILDDQTDEKEGMKPTGQPDTNEDKRRALRITDPDKVAQRADALPEAIRELVENKFKAEYVALEKIDPEKLI